MIPPMGIGPNLPGSQFMNSSYPFIIAIIVGVIFGIRHYFRGPQWTNVGNLTGKIVIITGANSGIGLELVKIFCETGAKVYIGCRSKEKAQEAISAISQFVPNPAIHSIPLDLASFKSVKAFAAAFLKRESQLDLLINNAGVLVPPAPEYSVDGVETHFQVNYLGHFLLTHLLLDVLSATPNSRVINNTSHAYNLVSLQLDDLIDKSQFVDMSFPQAQSVPVLESESANRKEGQGGKTKSETIKETKNKAEATAKKINQSGGDNSNQSEGENTNQSEGENADQSEGENANQSEKNIDEPGNSYNRRYAVSKLALVMFTLKMSQLFQKKSPSFLVANPGIANTNIHRNLAFVSNTFLYVFTSPFMWFLSKTAKDGAQTILYAATSSELEGISGKYLIDCAEGKLKESVKDSETIDYLYIFSRKVCQKWLKS